MTLEQLTDLGTAALTCVDSAPSGLPAPLVYVLLSRNGNAYTIINDEFAPVLQALKANQDTEIRAILTMWKDGGPDLPSYAFRTALLELDPSNSEAELLGIHRTLDSTMYHK